MELDGCGAAVAQLLALSPCQSVHALLLKLANDGIAGSNYASVPLHWLRLHLHATLLGVHHCLATEPTPDYLALVEQLDRTLIISGAPGRREEVLSLIATIQEHVPHASTPSSTPIPSISAPYLLRPIPVFDHPGFLLPDHPIIIRAAASHWPAVARWGNFSYLSKLAGPGRQVPVEVGLNYTTQDWGQRITPFDTFLHSLAPESKEKLYLAQHDLLNQFPRLRDDIVIPDLVYSSPDAPPHFPTYTPPGNDDGYLINAWLGPAGTVSPAHTDPYFNCFVQVVGKKWIWIAPPSVSDVMDAFGAAAAAASNEDEEMAGATALMSNTTRLDLTLSPSDPSLANAVEYQNTVVPLSQQAVLEPGDMLFMPPGWWHAMKALDVSFSVSVWF